MIKKAAGAGAKDADAAAFLYNKDKKAYYDIFDTNFFVLFSSTFTGDLLSDAG